MQPTTNSGFDLVYVVLIAFGVVLIASVGLLVWVIYRVGRIELPAGTGFWATLRVTPLSVVILLDLLDFALDFLSARQPGFCSLGWGAAALGSRH